MLLSVFALVFLLISCSSFEPHYSRKAINAYPNLGDKLGYRSVSPLLMAPGGKGGKQASFGIFSPAVYLAKAVLGESKLNKVF